MPYSIHPLLHRRDSHPVAGLGGAMPSSTNVVLIIIAATISTWIWRKWYLRSKIRTRTLPLPPGPTPLPIIGNLFDIPTSYPWLKVNGWSKIYGDIIHVHTLGTHIVYLNSWEHANELFQKRAVNYSSRPKLYMLYDVLDAEWIFTLKRYGSKWRESRKLFHQYFHQSAVQVYRPLQLLEARKLLLKLLETPEDFFQHIRHSVAATIIRITYGIEIEDHDDPNVAVAELAMQHFADAGTPGAFVVDILPILKYVPEWFPGGGYKKIGRTWKADMYNSRDLLYQRTKKLVGTGKSLDSVTASILQKNMNPSKEEEEIIMSVIGTAYLGGADTTVSTIQSFFQAIALNPHVQVRAQKELDEVLGSNRLPEFEDRPSLPYVEAIVKESFRWHPVGPFGVPHLATEDDEYNGYRIPKDTVMIANQWSMLHNEAAYPEPHLFRPERFLDTSGNLDSSVPNPELATFGFGKRICPGRHMVSNTAFITIASVLATLDIQHALDESGEKIPISDEVTSGLVSYPVPFKCSIKPRSQAKVDLIHRSLDILRESSS